MTPQIWNGCLPDERLAQERSLDYTRATVINTNELAQIGGLCHNIVALE
jgi:hypothetical protein